MQISLNLLINSRMIKMKMAIKLVVVGYVCMLCVSVWACSAEEQNRTLISVNVGVILDADTFDGKMGLSCIHMALSDFYVSHHDYKTRLLLNFRDSKKDELEAASAAVELIENGQVEAIIGPQSSSQAKFVIAIGEKTQVPVISFSARSPSLISPRRSPYFFRVAQDDSAQVKAIAAIVEAFGWTEVAIIGFGGIHWGALPYLSQALQEAYVRISYQSAISPSATDEQIFQELSNLRAITARVYIVHVSPIIGARLFTRATESGMMTQGYVWIMTNMMSNRLNELNSSVIDSMQGVLGVSTYFPKTDQLQDFEVRWQMKFQQDNPSIRARGLNVFGLWAYDAATALATAVEKAATENLSILNTSSYTNNNNNDHATHLGTLWVSQVGPEIREALSNTSFRGLDGEYFHFVNGQVESSNFQIINVIGDGKRVVGFWTPQNGLTRNLVPPDTTSTSAGPNPKKNILGPIIWPGDTTNLVPKGRQIPANAKTLKVGIPVKQGFNELVRVTFGPNTNTTAVTGYCIDIFEAVVRALPYELKYQFIPFAKPNGERAGTYDDLITQVYFGKFDAVVGDTTISANRSRYVDFTLPYTGNEATFIVPTRDESKTNAWIFLKPLTWELWVTIGCFFVFIGFVVWVLEHRDNEEFQGPLSYQICTSLWFAFATLVFAHREKVSSNLGKFVVIIWVFVVLILTQSYTASLSSFLTVQQLRPSFRDVDELLKNGVVVGYQHDSFTYGILRQMGFDDSQLRHYNSPEECDRLLTLGSRNGGIDAAFDEIPYLQLLLSSYWSKYTTMGPTIKTEGFGFAFPINSHLVPGISRAILNVTETHNIMKALEEKWFKNSTPRQAPNAVNTCYSLALHSFRELFLIAGIASSAALLLHLYQHRCHFLTQFRLRQFIRDKISVISRICRHAAHVPQIQTSNVQDENVGPTKEFFATEPSVPKFKQVTFRSQDVNIGPTIAPANNVWAIPRHEGGSGN